MVTVAAGTLRCESFYGKLSSTVARTIGQMALILPDVCEKLLTIICVSVFWGGTQCTNKKLVNKITSEYPQHHTFLINLFMYVITKTKLQIKFHTKIVLM